MIDALAVDGGQTAIRVRHSAVAGDVEVDGVSRQEGDVVDTVAAAVAEGWHRLGSPSVDRVMLGLTTAPGDRAAADRMGLLISEAVGAAGVWISDDAVTAHAGALSGCPGVSIVVGTGVACLAMPEQGPPRIIGGHGFLLGDDGGGFWIGRAGLRASLRARDGRGASTSLGHYAERRYGSLADVHVRLHEADRPVAAIAAFAADVLEADVRGDEIARAIVDEAVDEIVLLARIGAEAIGSPSVKVALGGRLLAAGSPLRDRVHRRIRESEARIVPQDPEGSPLDGAMSLGRAGDPGRYADLVHVWRRT
jgi:N-acetylglucosamine kinase-like BadF-type ATPase